MKKKPTRGGKREGAGRKAEGKKNYTVSLNEKNAEKAKRGKNFSGFLDGLISDWLLTHK